MGNIRLNCCKADLYSLAGTLDEEIKGPNKPETKMIVTQPDARSEGSVMSPKRSTEFRGRLTQSSQFIQNDHEVSVHILLSQNYYYTLCQNENLNEFLKPLESFSIESLIHIIYAIYEISTNLIEIAQTKKIQEIYKEKLEIFFKGDIKFHTDIGDRGEYIKAITDLTEIYHYYKYWLSGQKGVYITSYWIKYSNKEEYMTEKIIGIQRILAKIIGS